MTPAPPVRREPTRVALVLHVHGVLDGDTGQRLLAEVEDAASTCPPRIEIDLGGLDGFTPEGAAALAACRDFHARFPDGLHYRTLDGPSREAFLTAFQ